MDPISETEKNQIAIYANVLYAIGLLAGSSIIGFVQDKYGYNASILIVVVFNVLVGITFLYQNEVEEFSFTMTYICMFGAGLIDNYMTSFNNIYLAQEFTTKVTQFGAKTFLESGTISLILLTISLFNIKLQKAHFRLYFIALYGIGIISLINLKRSLNR